jgi:ATP-dependent DNA ligase
MIKAYEFALPVLGDKVPADPWWIHEVKHNGYRLRVERDGKKVRLISKGGNDFTNRYPWIIEAALEDRITHLVWDGEAVVLCSAIEQVAPDPETPQSAVSKHRSDFRSIMSR